MKKYLHLHSVCEIILFRLYELTMSTQDREAFELEELLSDEYLDLPVNQVKMSLKLLSSKNDRFGPAAVREISDIHFSGYEITENGVLYIEDKIVDESSIPSIIMNEKQVNIFDIAGINRDTKLNKIRDIYNSEEWTPLEIDRDDGIFHETIDAVKVSIEIIRNDNGFAANEPELREGLLDTLNEGLDQIENKTPSSHLIRRLLIDPFLLVAKKFGNSVIGNAGKIAADHLTRWLQSLL
jgi:hypothetical protein